jgi:hypothetical protein
MFKSPFSRFVEDHKENDKVGTESKISKSSPGNHDDIAKSVTVNQHHDGSYSVSDGENAPSMHEGLDEAMTQAHSLHESLQNPAEGHEQDDMESHGHNTTPGSKQNASVSPRKGAVKQGSMKVSRNV